VRESLIEGLIGVVRASIWLFGRGREYFSPRDASFCVAE
jgi:hypothetical protein